MGFLDSDGPIGGIAIFKHEEITEKRLWAPEIGSFPESRPEVKGAADCFLSSVVEVVAEGRANL